MLGQLWILLCIPGFFQVGLKDTDKQLLNQPSWERTVSAGSERELPDPMRNPMTGIRRLRQTAGAPRDKVVSGLIAGKIEKAEAANWYGALPSAFGHNRSKTIPGNVPGAGGNEYSPPAAAAGFVVKWNAREGEVLHRHNEIEDLSIRGDTSSAGEPAGDHQIQFGGVLRMMSVSNAPLASAKIEVTPDPACTISYSSTECSIALTGTVTPGGSENVKGVKLATNGSQTICAALGTSCSGSTVLHLGSPVTFTLNWFDFNDHEYSATPSKTVNARVSLSVVNNGGGTVTSVPVGINCGGGCSTQDAPFNYGDSVNLTAVPDYGYTLDSWSGDCTGSNPAACQLLMNAPKRIAATFKKQYVLIINGNGNGSVKVDGTSHTLPWSGGFNPSAVVQIEAVPDAGWKFGSWSGDLLSAANPTSITMDSNKNVTVTFNQTTYALNLTKTGNGSVKVDGTLCTPPWTGSFASGVVVQLEAVPDGGWGFSSWSGDLSGNANPASITMNSNKTVAAAFSQGSFTLDLTRTGNGSVKVDGTMRTPPWTGSFASGAIVQLEAVPDSGWGFGSWSGDLSGSAVSSSITMNSNKNVAAVFSQSSFTLNLTKVGSGSVKVNGNTRVPPWTESFLSGSIVQLEAVADANWNFSTWSGDLTGSTNPASITMNGNKNIAVTFNQLAKQTLTVVKAGQGKGTVTSAPQGIDCGSTCSAGFNYGSSVILTATADTGNSFASWVGCDSYTGSQCTVTMNQARSVTATFDPPGKQTLSVKKQGTGSGTVTSLPAGINCGGACSFDFNFGVTVTLSAKEDAGFVFTGWDGEGCSGAGTCTVAMNQFRRVTANFDLPNKQTLTVTKFGSGTGVITSVPDGIKCDSNCRNQNASFDNNATVTLTAMADSGSEFGYWSGCDPISGNQCTVKMTRAVIVFAIFNPKQYNLTITKGGSGTGTVASSIGGINCGFVCKAGFDPGTALTLIAKADTGFSFAGWSGAGCSGTGNCAVTMNQDLQVIATFDSATKKAILVSPTGTTITSTPAYVWQAVAASTWYQLVVWDAANASRIQKWYTAAEAGCGSGIGQCSITPSTQLDLGSYRWWIQTYINGGNGPWSDALSFTIFKPDKPVSLSPTGKILTSIPAYKWQAVPASTWYQLWVNDSSGAGKIGIWYTAAQAGCGSGSGTCSVTPITQLKSGSYQWWVQTYVNNANGLWSDGLIFTVLPPPGKSALISPSGKTFTAVPTFRWVAVSMAIRYQMLLMDAGNNVKAQTWYSAAQAGCGIGSGQCSIVLQTALPLASYRWWIQASNDIGDGEWSDEMAFTVSAVGPPGKATLVSPSGNISTNQPTYTWNAVILATWYLLWVNDSTTSAGKINVWYTAAQAGCTTGTGACSVKPATTLGSGNAQWWVQTFGDGGYGAWSDALSFTVQSNIPPGKATQISPSGKITTLTPSYVWKAVSGATWYRLWVNDSVTSSKILLWYAAGTVGCASGTCSVTPSIALAPGVAQWWVQTWNSYGDGPWSDGMYFTAQSSGSFEK